MPNLNNIFPKEILVYLLKTNKNAYLTCILDILFNIKSIYIFIYIRPYIYVYVYIRPNHWMPIHLLIYLCDSVLKEELDLRMIDYLFSLAL